MSNGPPSGTTDVTEWLWRRRNTTIHAGLGVTGILVGVLGAVGTIWLTGSAGLFIPSQIFRGWVATFDYVNCALIIMWATTFIRFGIHDRQHYQLRLRARVRRTTFSDVVVIAAYPAAGVLWGELALRPVLAGRAVAPAYLRRLPSGTPPEALQTGVDALIVTYYALLALVLVFYLIGLKFNPVDLDTYDRVATRVFRFERSPKRS